MRISFLDPSHGRSDGIIDINARQPAARRRRIRPRLDGCGQLRGVRFSNGDGGATSAFLWHFGVPNVVQVGGGAVEGHGDVVAAEVESFVVEGLVQIADELGCVN